MFNQYTIIKSQKFISAFVAIFFKSICRLISEKKSLDIFASCLGGRESVTNVSDERSPQARVRRHRQHVLDLWRSREWNPWNQAVEYLADSIQKFSWTLSVLGSLEIVIGGVFRRMLLVVSDFGICGTIRSCHRDYPNLQCQELRASNFLEPPLQALCTRRPSQGSHRRICRQHFNKRFSGFWHRSIPRNFNLSMDRDEQHHRVIRTRLLVNSSSQQQNSQVASFHIHNLPHISHRSHHSSHARHLQAYSK